MNSVTRNDKMDFGDGIDDGDGMPVPKPRSRLKPLIPFDDPLEDDEVESVSSSLRQRKKKSNLLRLKQKRLNNQVEEDSLVNNSPQTQVEIMWIAKKVVKYKSILNDVC